METLFALSTALLFLLVVVGLLIGLRMARPVRRGRVPPPVRR